MPLLLLLGHDELVDDRFRDRFDLAARPPDGQIKLCPHHLQPLVLGLVARVVIQAIIHIEPDLVREVLL